MLAAVAIGMWIICFGIALIGGRRQWWRRGVSLDVAGVGALAAASIGFFWRIIWGGSWMPADGGDLVSFLYPTYSFISKSLQNGTLALWNPHLYGGAPLVGDIQAGLFYPVNLLVLSLARPLTYETMQWLSMGHIWWAGTGMYFLLRLEAWRGGGSQLSRWASLFGALAFMFSDGFLVHFGNLNLISVASWLPWVFLAFLPSLGPGRLFWRWSILAGLLLGIATLAGHAQVTIYIALALSIMSGLMWITQSAGEESRDLARSATKTLASLAICLVVAVLISAVVLLPGLELTQRTARSAWDYQQTVDYSLSPAQWIGLIIPGYFGRGPQFHWGLWPRVEVGYVGVLTLLLAMLALLRGRPRIMWSTLGLAITSLIIALGIYAVPHGWLTTLVPGFGQFRAPARLVMLLSFGLASLAAMGLDALIRSAASDAEAKRRAFRATLWATGSTIAVALPLAYHALITKQDAGPDVFVRVSVAVIGLAIFSALLLTGLLLMAASRYKWFGGRVIGLLAVVVLFLDLSSVGAYSDLGAEDPSRSFHHPEIASFLQNEPGVFRIDSRSGIESIWQPSTALLIGQDDVWGVVNPLILEDYERYWEGTGGRSSRLYDLLGARYVVARKDVELDWSKFEMAFDGDPQLNLYRNTSAVPRAFLVHEKVSVSSQESAWSAIRVPGFDPTRVVVLEGGQMEPAPLQGPELTRIERRGANEFVVNVQVSAPAYLVLSDVYYPGWQVVDHSGVHRELLRANYAFSAVAVEEGTSELHFTYAPKSFRLGAGISIATILSLAAWATWLSVIRLRRKCPPRS